MKDADTGILSVGRVCVIETLEEPVTVVTREEPISNYVRRS